jgi:hypothetical protein
VTMHPRAEVTAFHAMPAAWFSSITLETHFRLNHLARFERILSANVRPTNGDDLGLHMAFRNILAAAVLRLIIAIHVARADEGRIPIFEPTTITASGSYVVTNDFSAGSGTAIVVSGADVTLDLGGHTVTGNIHIGGLLVGESRTWVRNGRIVGGFANGSTNVALRVPTEWTALRLSNISGVGGGVGFFASTSLVIEDSRIDGDVSIVGNVGNVVVDIRDSRFTAGVSLAGASKSVIRGNSFLTLSVRDGDGFLADRNIIESNVVSGTFTLGRNFGSSDTAPRNLVKDNILGAFSVLSHDNQIVGNTVRGGNITVNGSGNVIEGNSVNGPGFALVLAGDDNLYRNNVLRNGSGPVQNTGTGNVDAGGNVN